MSAKWPREEWCVVGDYFGQISVLYEKGWNLRYCIHTPISANEFVVELFLQFC